MNLRALIGPATVAAILACAVTPLTADAGGTAAFKRRVESLEHRTPEQRAARREAQHAEFERKSAADISAARARRDQLKSRWEATTSRERAAASRQAAKQRRAKRLSASGAEEGLE